MALSDYEKQVLEQMEEELRRGDPDLVSHMSGGEDWSGHATSSSSILSTRITPKRIACGILLVVVGLGVLVGAVSLGYSQASILLGVLGFVLMVGGVLYAMGTSFRRSKKSSSEGKSPRSSRTKDGWSGWQTFLEDQERRWDERREE